MLELVQGRGGDGKAVETTVSSFGEILDCFSIFSETAKGIFILSHLEFY